MTSTQPASAWRRIELGDIDPARSRHMWTRSSVHLADELRIAGRWGGTITAFDHDTLEPQWNLDSPGHPARLATLENTLIVGSRGERGTIAAYALDSGALQWRYETATDLGPPATERIFALPYVVGIETDPDRGMVYVAARRYERIDGNRKWHSVVYAITANGRVRWQYKTDASSISLALDDAGERLAAGYNRCSGSHDVGLVVLDPASGDPCWSWDPGTSADRRVGDVSFDGDHLAVSSHGDKRGYYLDPTGDEQWRVDLAVETDIGGETLYAYPNHVFADSGRVVFATGNTYATDRRETNHRHPNEHRLAAFDRDGQLRWEQSLYGFAHELTATGEHLVVPSGQNFRVRDPATHTIHWFDIQTGRHHHKPLEGIATVVAADGTTLAAIEEPVAYHDDDRVHGSYTLWTTSLE